MNSKQVPDQPEPITNIKGRAKMKKLIAVQKDLKESPELESVEIIEVDRDGLGLYFKPGTQRTGKELLEVQKILFNYKIFNFIKSEKCLLYENEIKEISISIY